MGEMERCRKRLDEGGGKRLKKYSGDEHQPYHFSLTFLALRLFLRVGKEKER